MGAQKRSIDTDLSRGASLHVMCSAPGEEEFIMELNKSREQKHLRLAPSRHGIPGRKSAGRDRGEVEAVSKLAGETNAGTDGPPSDEGGHGNTPMLNFRVTVPGDGLVGALLSETKRIPDLAELGAVGLREGRLARHAGLQVGGGDRVIARRRERRGCAEGGKENSRFHG